MSRFSWFDIKIKNMCSICLDDIFLINRKVLICGHVFHKNCISKILRPNCPLCETYIFNDLEEKLIKFGFRNQKHKIIQILRNSTELNIKELYTFAIDKNLGILIEAMFETCDFSQVLVDNFSNYELVKFLLEKNKNNEILINWFKTFNGLSIFELIYDQHIDEKIRTLILDHFPTLFYQPPKPSAPLIHL